jgi:ribosomal protein S3
MISTLFKPKSKKDILEDFKNLSVESFNKAIIKYEQFYDDKVSIEYYPFVIRLKIDLKNRGYLIGENGFKIKKISSSFYEHPSKNAMVIECGLVERYLD